MQDKINIIFTDDMESYREAVAIVLKSFNINTIAHAANGKVLLSLLFDKKLEPDAILLDIDMDEMDGITALEKIREVNRTVKIIMLSMYEDVSLVADCKAKGADGFLFKNNTIENIASTIRRVCLATDYSNIPKKLKPIFTKAELEIMKLMFERKTIEEIARMRGKSLQSVEAHRKRMYEKVGAKTSADFMRYSTKEGLPFLAGHDKREPT